MRLADDALFVALSDKTRRAIVESLAKRPHSPGELSQRLAVSPQALSRHLRALRKCGVVQFDSVDADARMKVYRIEPNALAPLRNWLDRTERMWTKQLASFKTYAESQ